MCKRRHWTPVIEGEVAVRNHDEQWVPLPHDATPLSQSGQRVCEVLEDMGGENTAVSAVSAGQLGGLSYELTPRTTIGLGGPIPDRRGGVVRSVVCSDDVVYRHEPSSAEDRARATDL